jgi:FtsH-binding integral membrane protein
MFEPDNEEQAFSLGDSHKDFDNKQDRLGFIRKVYSILGTQILLTACLTIIPKESYSLRVWMI